MSTPAAHARKLRKKSQGPRPENQNFSSCRQTLRLQLILFVSRRVLYPRHSDPFAGFSPVVFLLDLLALYYNLFTSLFFLSQFRRFVSSKSLFSGASLLNYHLRTNPLWRLYCPTHRRRRRYIVTQTILYSGLESFFFDWRRIPCAPLNHSCGNKHLFCLGKNNSQD